MRRSEQRVAEAVERGRVVVERAMKVLPPKRAAELARELDLLADDALRQLQRDTQWLGERARQ